MNRTIRLVVVSSTAVLLAACAVEERPQQPSAAAAVTQTTTTVEPPAREVKPSPEVLALLKPDPDLDVKMTEEQVRATLAAAANTDVPEKPRPAPNITGAAGDEWRRLEDKQSERNRDYRRRLESTTVHGSRPRVSRERVPAPDDQRRGDSAERVAHDSESIHRNRDHARRRAGATGIAAQRLQPAGRAVHVLTPSNP